VLVVMMSTLQNTLPENEEDNTTAKTMLELAKELFANVIFNLPRPVEPSVTLGQRTTGPKRVSTALPVKNNREVTLTDNAVSMTTIWHNGTTQTKCAANQMAPFSQLEHAFKLFCPGHLRNNFCVGIF